jgi:hypothetical protein
MRILCLYYCFVLTNFIGFSQDTPYFPIKKDNGWKIFHNGKITELKHDYQYVHIFDEKGYAYFLIDNKFGFIDTTGKEIIPATFQSIEWITQNFYSIIDQKHTYLFSPEKNFKTKVNWFKAFDQEWIVFQSDTTIQLMNTHWKKPLMIDNETLISSFNNYLLLEFKSKAHVYQPNGMLIDTLCSQYELTEEHFYLHSKNQHFILWENKKIELDKKSEFGQFFDDHYYYIVKDSIHFIDYRIGKELFKIKGNSLALFYNFYKVKENNKIGLISKSGKTLIQTEYSTISKNGQYYTVSKNGFWGMMNEDFKEIINPNFNLLTREGDFVITEIITPSSQSYYGVFSLRNSKRILETIYTKVIVSDTIVKAWNKKNLVVVILYKNHSKKEEIFFENVISINQKQKKQLPIDFDQRLLDVGWFLDTVTRYSKDSSYSYYNRWGFKRNDSVILKPCYKNLIFVENAHFSLNKLKLQPKKINIQNQDEEFSNHFLNKEFNISFYAAINYKLIPFSNLRKKDMLLLAVLDTSSFHQNYWVKGLTNNGFCFISKEGDYKPVTYFSKNNTGFIKYCTEGEFIETKNIDRNSETVQGIDLVPFLYPEIENNIQFKFQKKFQKPYLISKAKWNYLKPNGDSLFYEGVDYLESFIKNTAIVKIHQQVGLTDTQGYVIPPIYLSIKRLKKYDDTLFLVGKTNIGHTFIDSSFNSIPLSNGKVCSKGKNITLIALNNENYVVSNNNEIIGKTISPKIYEFDYLVEKKSKKYCIRNCTLNQLLETYNKPLHFISKDLFICESIKGVGVQNLNGDTILPLNYKKIYSSGNFIIAFKENVYTIFDHTLRILHYYKNAEIFIDNQNSDILIKETNQIIIQNKDFKKLYKWENKSKVDTFCRGFVLMSNKNLFYKTGKQIDPKKTIQKVQFLDSLIVIKLTNNQFQLYKINGDEIFTSSFITHFTYYGKGTFSYFDKNQKKSTLYSLSSNKGIDGYEKIIGTLSSNSHIFIFKNKTTYMLDSNLYIQATLYDTEVISSIGKQIIVKKNTGYSIVNLKGELKSIPLHGKISVINENLFQVENKPLFGILNSKGKNIIPPIFENIAILPNGYIQTINGNDVEYYDSLGTKITF